MLHTQDIFNQTLGVSVKQRSYEICRPSSNVALDIPLCKVGQTLQPCVSASLCELPVCSQQQGSSLTVGVISIWFVT